MARKPSAFRAPFLKRVWTDMDALAGASGYPFDLPLVRKGAVEIEFDRPVTIIVGENGTGKSTILEAMTGPMRSMSKPKWPTWIDRMKGRG
jgi:predicted ATPase